MLIEIPTPKLGLRSLCAKMAYSSQSMQLSAFTHRHLSQMASYSTATPLRVIAHIDLDAFYAQCEMVRLGVSEDVPLAVQQWQNLIAVNYPARKFGITRRTNITEARKLCPHLVAQHVATWREGDDKWSYRPDAAANIARDKVSLDPYRLESRRILTVIEEALPQAPLQRIEKAGIDEVFVDLSAHVHHVLLARFPELQDAAGPGADLSRNLPPPPVTALDWNSDHLVALDEAEEARDPDWDDVVLSIGADIVRDVRARVRERLHYTCSGGISHNKLLSKLGSAQNKPNKQTVIRSRAVTTFLATIKFTKMRNLGGKLGDQVASEFDTEEINELLSVPLVNLKARLGQDTGLWVYNTIRGIDHSEVNPRTKIKSMLSAKSFRPPIHTREQAERWIKIFAADIFARLVVEGILENRRRPKSLTLHLRHNGHTRSRQTPIPPGKPLNEAALAALGNTLLTLIMSEGEVWPCLHMNMSVSGLEDGVTGNLGIGTFLMRGSDARVLNDVSKPLLLEETTSLVELNAGHTDSAMNNLERKRRHSGGSNIEHFFAKPTTPEKTDGPHHSTYQQPKSNVIYNSNEPNHDAPSSLASGLYLGRVTHPDTIHKTPGNFMRHSKQDLSARENMVMTPAHRCPSHFSQTAADEKERPASYTCSKCSTPFSNYMDLQSHNDWHVAMDLQERDARVEERVRSAFAGRGIGDLGQKPGAKSGKSSGRKLASGLAASSSTSTSGRRGRGRGTKPGLEPGQRRLDFG
ncbi:hypothetical protein jhhlp_001348 [Lomentospora prolificans]|uniref:DNA polymerase eta n=1 Tax=Lomentospora prolificans TaxID=41688 RepID=A0A2N3NI73_9PEZI|nr:hypothetical protein jhhlp_001348 [Lomentospora prolificans]